MLYTIHYSVQYSTLYREQYMYTLDTKQMRNSIKCSSNTVLG